MNIPTTGCQQYGTSVIKKEECILLAETMLENGADIQTALQDISLIDDCLAMARMVRTIGKTKSVMYTKNGNIRKNRAFSDFVNSRIDSMIKK
jgi:hypothetical protein